MKNKHFCSLYLVFLTQNYRLLALLRIPLVPKEALGTTHREFSTKFCAERMSIPSFYFAEYVNNEHVIVFLIFGPGSSAFYPSKTINAEICQLFQMSHCNNSNLDFAKNKLNCH